MIINYTDVLTAKNKADLCLKSVCKGYEIPEIVDIKFTNATGYWAKIDKRNLPKGKFKLIIGGLLNLITDHELKHKRLEETIVHEMIHTIPGCFNHGNQFKYYCMLLNHKFGFNLSRTTSTVDFGITLEHKSRPTKYVITCPHCGKQYFYSRKPVYAIDTYSCGRCGSAKLILETA